MSAIARAGTTATPAAPTPPKRSAPELDAQMRTCRAQLADWVTCPSAKTPEGKAKIEQISAKLLSIKDQIKKTDGSPPVAATASPGATNEVSAKSADPTTYLDMPGQLGSHVDVYA